MRCVGSRLHMPWFITWYVGVYKFRKQFGTKRLANDDHGYQIKTGIVFTMYEQSRAKRVKEEDSVTQVSLFLYYPLIEKTYSDVFHRK